jgi:RNA-directed DNA polymerase
MQRKQRNTLQVRDCWLYAIASKRDLAHRLSTDHFAVSVKDLEKLARDAGNFKLFSIQANNSERRVQEPKHALQRLHTRIHKLLSRIIVPEYLHSAVKGRSYLTNARTHSRDVPTIKIDVKKFFQSVPRVAIFKFFSDTMKCRKDVAGLLADLLTFNAHLPTGSSASPIISYYAFKLMFDQLYELATAHGLTMTCYVDDITFSGANASHSVLYEAHKTIAKHGLKSHKMKVFSASQPKVITRVCNTPEGERVPNKLHLKINKGFTDLRAASSAEEKAKTLRPLLGRLEAARQIDPIFGARAKTLRSKMRHVLETE